MMSAGSHGVFKLSVHPFSLPWESIRSTDGVNKTPSKVPPESTTNWSRLFRHESLSLLQFTPSNVSCLTHRYRSTDLR